MILDRIYRKGYRSSTEVTSVDDDQNLRKLTSCGSHTSGLNKHKSFAPRWKKRV